jgi:hypothetical protein
MTKGRGKVAGSMRSSPWRDRWCVGRRQTTPSPGPAKRAQGLGYPRHGAIAELERSRRL